MTETFDFKLISPEKTIFSGYVRMVVIPGLKGDFGVLPHHAALISTLRPGLVHIYQADTLLHSIYVSTGFANVNEKGCVVLAQDCLFLQDLDKVNLEETIRQKLEELENTRSEERREALRRDVYFANIKLQIIAKNMEA